MARRRRSNRRTFTGYARRGYSRRKGLLSGNVGNMIIGAVAGAASNYIPPVLGGFTKPVAFGAAGYLLKKPALFTIAGYEAGKMLASGFLGNGNGDSGGYL